MSEEARVKSFPRRSVPPRAIPHRGGTRRNSAERADAAQLADSSRGTALAGGLYRRFLMKTNVGSTLIAAGALAAITMLATPSHAQNQPVQVSPMPYPTTPYRAPAGAERTEFATPNPVLLGG